MIIAIEQPARYLYCFVS